MTRWRRRREPAPPAAVPAAPAAPPPWPPQVASALTLRLLGLTEQQREVLDTLQRAEDDPRTLELLYRLDHGNAQVRRLSRGLQILAGEPAGYGGGHPATVFDVVGMATAMVGQYQRVRVAELVEGVAPPHFAEDLGLLLAELLDNGTRYGDRATVGAHRMESGTVVFHVRDGGAGCSPDWMARVNAWLAGTIQPVTVQTGRHSGLTVVHHLARRHGLQVNLAASPPGEDGSGTLVTVYVPARLLPGPRPEPEVPEPPHPAEAEAADLPRRVPGSAYTGGEDPAPPVQPVQPPGGGTLADLAAAFSPDPEHQE
ncbi:ATP-binding protein [Actinocorallia populi]|uniref:ATP-binding protein n=1 Tax=Actinocorallia populi TaxID=2079200 RepID=UPI000D09085A|nr:ATP-binding protein [Actinocorallia populi]